jgi:hypothetical protein
MAGKWLAAPRRFKFLQWFPTAKFGRQTFTIRRNIAQRKYGDFTA